MQIITSPLSTLYKHTSHFIYFIYYYIHNDRFGRQTQSKSIRIRNVQWS
jgi:hypothetical protein